MNSALPDAGQQLSVFYQLTQPKKGPFCLLRSRDKRHLWTEDGHAGLVELTLANANEVDLYCGTMSFVSTASRTSANVYLARAFRADFDAGPEKVAKHGITKVYATGEDADADVVKFGRVAARDGTRTEA